MSAIFKALAAAQKNFESARKQSENGHFKSKYADLSNCMDAVRLPCNEQGIFVTQTIESVESGVLVETVFAHESGEMYTGGKLFMPVTKHDAHGYGSALTYARRYSLLAACGVAPEDDDGNQAAAAKPEKIIHTPTGHPIVEPHRMAVIADVADSIANHFGKDDLIGAYEEYLGIVDNEERTALWKLLPSNIRSAIKKHGAQVVN